MALSVTDLRPGTIYTEAGQAFLVLRYTHTKMGRGMATIKVKARNIVTGVIIEKSYNNGAKVDEANVGKMSAQYLYQSPSAAVFMDLSSFEQIEIAKENIQSEIPYLKEGDKVIIIMYDTKPLSIELPKNVNLKVTYAEPGVKGDTAQTALMKARVETGLEVMVPMFIKIDDIIKVDTRTGEYLERA